MKVSHILPLNTALFEKQPVTAIVCLILILKYRSLSYQINLKIEES